MSAGSQGFPTAGADGLQPRERDALGLLTLYVVILLLLPARLVFGPLGPNGSPATLIGLGLLAWWTLIRVVPSIPVPRGAQPMRYALAVLVGAILASYAWSALHPLPIEQRSAADRAIVFVLAVAGPLLVAADLLNSRRSVEALLRRVTLLVGVVAAMGALQFATGFDLGEAIRVPGLHANGSISLITEGGIFRRVSSTMDHPIELGIVLAATLPFAFHFEEFERRRRPLWVVLLFLIACTIPMTLSRTGIIGLLVGTAVMFAGWNGARRVRFLMVAPVAAVCMRFAIPGLVGTINSLFANASTDPSVQGRTDDYAKVGDFISASPWLGRGFGTFIPQKFFFLDNQYLGSLIETGVIGLVALLAFFLTAWTSARAARHYAHGADQRDLAQALAASIAVVAVGFSMFDGLGFATITGLLFLFAGCAAALRRIGREEARARAVAAPATSGVGSAA